MYNNGWDVVFGFWQLTSDEKTLLEKLQMQTKARADSSAIGKTSQGAKRKRTNTTEKVGNDGWE